MIKTDKALISSQIAEIFFCCNPEKCKGGCCIEGDAGAPLTEEEISILEDEIDKIKPFMNEEGIKVIDHIGVFEFDQDGTFVTPLVNNRECAFVIFENEIASCAIEKAWSAGVQKFRKPISCHLYPIRITKLKDFDAVNYHEWTICKSALDHGEKLKLPLIEFVKDALIRKYGKECYEDMVKQFNQI